MRCQTNSPEKYSKHNFSICIARISLLEQHNIKQLTTYEFNVTVYIMFNVTVYIMFNVTVYIMFNVTVYIMFNVTVYIMFNVTVYIMFNVTVYIMFNVTVYIMFISKVQLYCKIAILTHLKYGFFYCKCIMCRNTFTPNRDFFWLLLSRIYQGSGIGNLMTDEELCPIFLYRVSDSHTFMLHVTCVTRVLYQVSVSVILRKFLCKSRCDTESQKLKQPIT